MLKDFNGISQVIIQGWANAMERFGYRASYQIEIVALSCITFLQFYDIQGGRKVGVQKFFLGPLCREVFESPLCNTSFNKSRD